MVYMGLLKNNFKLKIKAKSHPSPDFILFTFSSLNWYTKHIVIKCCDALAGVVQLVELSPMH